MVMPLAFTLLFLTLHLAAMRNEIMRRRVRTMLMMQADAADRTLRMNLGPYAAFIVTAYAAAIVIVGGTGGLGLLDRRHLVRVLAEIEAQGISRRSDTHSRGEAVTVTDKAGATRKQRGDAQPDAGARSAR